MKKSQLKKLIETIIKENVGYSHGYIGPTLAEKPSHDPLTDPLMVGKDVKEGWYDTHDLMIKDIENEKDFDKAIRKIYSWANINKASMSLELFEELLSILTSNVYKTINK